VRSLGRWCWGLVFEVLLKITELLIGLDHGPEQAVLLLFRGRLHPFPCVARGPRPHYNPLTQSWEAHMFGVAVRRPLRHGSDWTAGGISTSSSPPPRGKNNTDSNTRTH